MGTNESTDSGLDDQIARLQLEGPAVDTALPNACNKHVHVPVQDRYFVLYKQRKRGLAGAVLSPQGVGPSMWTDVKPVCELQACIGPIVTNDWQRMWDRAFESRAEWKDGYYIIGRARKGEVEVFDERDYQVGVLIAHPLELN